MKYINRYEEFIYESTTDGTIESLIDVTKFSMRMGIFDDDLLRDVVDDFVRGVEGSLKGQTNKLTNQQKKEFDGYVEAMMNPLRKSKNMNQFLGALSSIAIAKNNILKRMEMTESLDESVIINWLRKAKNATADWWDKNKYAIVSTIVEVLVQIVIEVLFAVLNGMLKSDIKAPKFKFGGGKSGGGGASVSF